MLGRVAWTSSAGLCCAVLGLTIVVAFSPRATGTPAGDDNPVAILHTSAGDIALELRADAAPCTVGAFIANAEDGVYDGTTIHDVSRAFVYGGCFLADGTVKQVQVESPGATENNNGLKHVRGRVGVRTTLGADGPLYTHEFYICLDRFPRWDGGMTLFAEVSDGIEIVDRIAASAGEDGTPSLIVTIKSVEIRGPREKAVHAFEHKLIRGRVLDMDGKGARGVDVGIRWKLEQDGRLRPVQSVKTDADGRFELEVRRRSPFGALVAYDARRQHGAIAVVRTFPRTAEEPVELELSALVLVRLSFDVANLKRTPEGVTAWFNAHVEHDFRGEPREIFGRVLEVPGALNRLECKLPPGDYTVYADAGGGLRPVASRFSVPPGGPVYDLGTLPLQPSPLAQAVGKAPPAWHVTEARAVAKSVQLGDYKGRWVLLEFWGYW